MVGTNCLNQRNQKKVIIVKSQFDPYIEEVSFLGPKNSVVKCGCPLEAGPLNREFLTLQKSKKVWDQSNVFHKCGMPLNRGAETMGFHCITIFVKIELALGLQLKNHNDIPKTLYTVAICFKKIFGEEHDFPPNKLV